MATEEPTNQQPFDLEKYKPGNSFVKPLIAAVHPDRIPEGQTVIGIAETSLLALPIDAVYPAVSSLKDAISSTMWYAKDHPEEVVPAASPLREIGDYLSSTLSDELSEEELTPSQRELRRRYFESQDNYGRYITFVDLNSRVSYLTAFFALGQEHLEEEQAATVESEVSDETVTEKWLSLRRILDDERRNEALSWKNLPEQQHPHHQDPKTGGSQDLGADLKAKHKLDTQQANGKAQTVAEIGLIVAFLETVPPETSARILWENILNEDERQKVLAIRRKFLSGIILAASIRPYLEDSHKDPAFIQLTQNKEEVNEWTGIIDDAYDTFLRDPEWILTSRHFDLPYYVISPFDIAYQGPPLSPAELEAVPTTWDRIISHPSSKRNRIRILASDVSTAFLLTDIPEGKAA